MVIVHLITGSFYHQGLEYGEMLIMHLLLRFFEQIKFSEIPE